MTAINITDLNNAKLDVDHIAEIATSPVLTATDRLGNEKLTIAGILDAFPNAAIDAAAAEASATAAGASAVAASASAASATAEAIASAASASSSTNQAAASSSSASTASAQAAASLASKVGAENARDAALLSRGIFATTAKGLSQGVVATTSLVAGSGGTNGTFALGFSGGAGAGAAGVFVVAGGALVSITMTSGGDSYTSAPAISFAASSGLTGASAVAVIADNVGVDEYFSVPSAVASESLLLYKNVAGVATLAATYPSSALVLDTLLAPDFMAGSNSLLRVVKKLRLYGTNPSKFYRVRYFFRDDAGVRFNFTIQQVDDAAGTGAVDAASFSSTDISYSGQQEFTLSEMGASGVSGTVIIDFTGAAAVWGIYAGSAETLIRQDTLETSAADTSYYETLAAGVVSANAALTEGLKLPFIDGLSNVALRRLVKNIWVYGADPTHEYFISKVEISAIRCKFILKDLTTGVEVAEANVTDAIPDYNALEPIWRLDQGVLATWTGVYAVMRIDWSEAITGTSNYTTMAESGINAAQLRSDEMISDYLSRDVWHEVIKVGPTRTYTTLRAAVESLYVAGLTTCARACYDHQILIDVDKGTVASTYIAIPAFVSVRGTGPDDVTVVKENNNQDAMFEAHYETKFSDMTIYSDTGDGGAWLGEYAIHSDDAQRSTIGGIDQNRRLRQSFKRMKFIGGPNQSAWIFGCGISSGQHIRFEDCIAEHEKADSDLPAFGFHNVGPTISVPTVAFSTKPALVELIGCRSMDATDASVYIQSLGAGNKSRLMLRDSSFGLIEQAVATGELDTDLAADRYEWEIGGVFDGPIKQADADMLVLKTTAGQVPSGSAAALIFGTTDELGRGNKWIKTGTTKSIGARLGDCSSVNKSLVIGAQTCTFNTNLTASSNAAVLAIINAALTTHPVSEKNIQFEIYPDTGFTRRMLNSSGATIPAGTFVKRSGASTITLAAAGDDILGWVYRDILNGTAGKVVTARRIYYEYITGAGADGKFGVTAAGLLDYSAATKIGFVSAGIVHLYA